MKVSDGEVKPRNVPRYLSLALPLHATVFHLIFYNDVFMLLKNLCIRHQVGLRKVFPIGPRILLRLDLGMIPVFCSIRLILHIRVNSYVCFCAKLLCQKTNITSSTV